MSVIGTIAVKVIADTQDFNQKMDAAKGKASMVAGKMKQAGAIMTAGLTLPIVAVGVKAMQMASDVEESISKVQALFGESADGVIVWSETTAEGFGIAKADALSFAGELGNVLIAQGLAEDSASTLAVDMVELAADMASFNNASPEETFRAIQSGAIGSSEPLRKYGVVIMEANVTQEALTMTGKTLKTELTEQDKTLARLKLITEQTSKAHGDFKKTQDGLSNSTKIAQAKMKDIGAELGEKLLPIGIKIIEMVTRVVDWFDNLSPSGQNVILIVIAIVAAMGPLLMILGTLISTFTAISAVTIPAFLIAAGPIILIILAIMAVIALLAFAWKNNWGGIRDKVKAVIDFMSPYIEKFTEGLTKRFAEAKERIAELRIGFENAFTGIKKAIGWVVDKLETFWSWLKKIKIPDWLKGKSPSPFEKSLRGIADAFDDINQKQLPTFATQLAGVGGRQTNVNYYLAYTGVESTEMDITQHLDTLELMTR